MTSRTRTLAGVRATTARSGGPKRVLRLAIVMLLLWSSIDAIAGAFLPSVHQQAAIAATPAPDPSVRRGPVMTDVRAFDVTQTSAQITWTLDVPSTGQVEYGRSQDYGNVTTPELGFAYTTHVQVDNLSPGTIYHFHVRSSNRAGVESVSADFTFSTLPTPTPFSTQGGDYNAIFAGDATGVTDVSAELRAFLGAHEGQRVALAVDGVYMVSQVSFTAADLTVDFRGSRLQGVDIGVGGILRIESSSHVVLNDPTVYGTGYAWDSASQGEHGIYVDGGSDIVINHPITRDTRGDGIYWLLVREQPAG